MYIGVCLPDIYVQHHTVLEEARRAWDALKPKLRMVVSFYMVPGIPPCESWELNPGLLKERLVL